MISNITIFFSIIRHLSKKKLQSSVFQHRKIAFFFVTPCFFYVFSVFFSQISSFFLLTQFFSIFRVITSNIFCL